MKLHYIVPTYKPKETGFSIAFYNMVKVFCENPKISEIIIYTSELYKEEEHKNVTIVQTKNFAWTSKFIRFLGKSIGKLVTSVFLKKDLNKITLSSPNDIILIESIYFSHIASILVDKFGQDKVFLRIHGALPETAFWTKDIFRNRLMDLVLTLDNILVTTYHYIDYLHNQYNIELSNSRNYFILPNTLPDIKIYKEEFFELKKIKILQLGRMDEVGFFQKGFQDSINALISLDNSCNEDVNSKIQVTFIGSGSESETFERFLNKISNINIDYFKTLSNKEVQDKINEADVILIPSRFEGMSMFATECLALGKAFIFTEGGGMRDMIFNNINGIAVRPFSHDDIGKAILKLINEPELIHQFSERSKLIFQENFSYSSVQNKLDTFLNCIIEKE